MRFRIDVLDTTGSGDAFDGVFVLATLDGWEPKKAASFANVVGALTVTGLGAFAPIPTREQALSLMKEQRACYLMSELVQDPPANVERRKVISAASNLRLQLREAKAKGMIPPELEGLNDGDFLRADFEGLKRIVDGVLKKSVRS